MDIEVEFSKGSLFLIAIILVSFVTFSAVSKTMMGHETLYVNKIKSSSEEPILFNDLSISIPSNLCVFTPVNGVACPDGWEDFSYDDMILKSEGGSYSKTKPGETNTGTSTVSLNAEDAASYNDKKSAKNTIGVDNTDYDNWPPYVKMKVCCRK